MLTGVHDVKTAVECIQLGAYNYITKHTEERVEYQLLKRAVERKRLSMKTKSSNPNLHDTHVPTILLAKAK